MAVPTGVHPFWKRPAAARLLAPLVLVSVCGASLAASGTLHAVSQRGRQFQPREITITRGDTLEIVNDDGDLLHHAYIESSDFSFDSGDQKPGSRTDIAFTKSGVFTILCGIHPKMKMLVTVQD